MFGPIPPSTVVPIIFCRNFAALPGPAFTPKSNTHKSKSNFKAFLNNWLATAMRNGKSVQQEDSRSNYKKYVPPVINEEDMASPEEIREILRRNR